MPGVPYAFAHPLAVIPLRRVLGRYAVPSALVIGSVVPDAWYFVPSLARQHSHGFAGLLIFCLPAGLFIYAAFHLVLKEPLLALVPGTLGARLHSFACERLPAAPWPAVVVCLATGALTHLAWDALTHPGIARLEAIVASVGGYDVRVHQVLQHGSTVLGTALLAAWAWSKLRAATPVAAAAGPSQRARNAIIGLFAMLAAAAACSVAAAMPWSDIQDARLMLRAAGITALSTLGLAVLAYCLLWRWLREPL